jgi:hypothetical protein
MPRRTDSAFVRDQDIDPTPFRDPAHHRCTNSVSLRGCAWRREETRESRGMPHLLLNTGRGRAGVLGGKTGFSRHFSNAACQPRQFAFTSVARVAS